jgi:hypothetical protein
MNPILPARLDWPSAIGNFLLNFGALDWQLFDFLERRLPPKQFSKTRKEHFQKRVARVKKLVGAGKFSAEQRADFEQFFTRLNSIRDLRNHIAHGHLFVRWLELGKEPVLTLSLPKDLNATDAPETRNLSFDELCQASEELTALMDEFQHLSNDWRTKRWTVEIP